MTSGTPPTLPYFMSLVSLFVMLSASYLCPTILSALARTVTKTAARVCPEGLLPVFTFFNTESFYTYEPQHPHRLSEPGEKERLG